MLKEIKIAICLSSFFFLAIFYKLALKPGWIFSFVPNPERSPPQEDVMNQRGRIIFVETTDHLEPSPLASCSVESAARIYQDRSVVYFMKGLKNNTELVSNSAYPAFTLLSAMENVHIRPFQMDALFQETPLLPWYRRVNPDQEVYWRHVSSDACRYALIWKYGGIYMDTDVISLRPISLENFLTAEDLKLMGSAIFGFSHHHPFVWGCMEDFVENYNGADWGYQGPKLLTRRLRALCKLTNFQNVENQTCRNISILHPQRFYPIPYSEWWKYFEVWETNPDFSSSFGLHLWNFMNKEHKTVVAGSNTLVETLYKKYCPTTYKVLLQGSGHTERN
ncbi:alpha-1,4-N-acetylglucosaminyltransferase-like [Carettochelys insculpta]|uniref:alpha-1,4-N-acetylglucosaminyltransferase-like n=1 Tax=Carettochelys insculpta TaxID=44489 RepID=UPI003EBC5BEF